MTTAASREEGTLPRFAPRNVVGVVLFVAWGIATIMWVASTINLAADGECMAIITAVAALALLVLLAVMEGARGRRDRPLEGDVPRPQHVAAGRLAGGPAALRRAHRDHRHASGQSLRGHRACHRRSASMKACPWRVFDIVMDGIHRVVVRSDLPEASRSDQSRPVSLAPTRSLFPVVEVVDKSGVPKPGAWTASAVERRLNWPLTDAEEMQEAVMPQRGVAGSHLARADPRATGEWRRSRLARRESERALE